LSTLEELDPGVVVPGHGDIGGVELITTQRGFMETMRAQVHEAADSGMAADEAVTALEPALHGLHPDWVQPEWVAFGIRCFHAERTRA
jgi:hypothetical protein